MAAPRLGAGEHSRTPGRPRRRIWRRLGWCLVCFGILLAIGRAILPWAVRGYVNRTLALNPLYEGRIGGVRINLLRGAYSIDDVRINKTTGNLPVPLFAAKRVAFALEWQPLLHGRVVGRVLMEQAELNFVDAPGDDEAQTGDGGPWLVLLADLFPFQINSAVIKDGSIHFRTYQAARPVDVYISQVQATVDNLGNILDETKPLVATVQAKGLVMDQAQFEYRMTLDPFSYRPTFHMGLRLLGLDVTKVNDLALAYGNFNFKRGWFDLVLETDVQEGKITGYAKPLFRNLQVFNLGQDLEEDGVLQFFWQALVGGATIVLKNHARDQFGTLIPFHGDATGATSSDLLATLGNILRNAFIRAYLPRLEGGQPVSDGIVFQAPDINDPLSPGDAL